MQRDGVVPFVPHVGIGAALEQGTHDLAVLDAEVQRGPQPGVSGQGATAADDIGMGVGQFDRAHRIAGVGGDQELRQRRRRVAAGFRDQSVPERRPALRTVLARERVLDVTKRGDGRRRRIGTRESGPRLSVAGAKRLEPALRVFAEIVEGTHRQPSFR